MDPQIKEIEEENRKLKEAIAIQTQEIMLLRKRMNSGLLFYAPIKPLQPSSIS